MADDTRPDLEKVHPRPDQAEEPADDVGASNVDLDEARHDDAHVSPAAPEPGHEPAHDGHDDHGHDDHGDHPVEDPRWVLAPVVVGLIVGIVLVIVLTTIGGGADVGPFHTL
jgi:hypothetical protein